MIFLKCKIRFIYVGFNCKRKKWGKKMSGNLGKFGKYHLKFPFIFYTFFFLLHLNPTYMKRILHLVSVKNITFKSSYNWFKIDIHQQLRKVWKYFLAFNVQSIIRKDGWIQNLFKDTEIQWKKAKCHLIALLPINMHSEKCANLRF